MYRDSIAKYFKIIDFIKVVEKQLVNFYKASASNLIEKLSRKNLRKSKSVHEYIIVGT